MLDIILQTDQVLVFDFAGAWCSLTWEEVFVGPGGVS